MHFERLTLLRCGLDKRCDLRLDKIAEQAARKKIRATHLAQLFAGMPQKIIRVIQEQPHAGCTHIEQVSFIKRAVRHAASE